jgi:hypothetical protein
MINAVVSQTLDCITIPGQTEFCDARPIVLHRQKRCQVLPALRHVRFIKLVTAQQETDMHEKTTQGLHPKDA